MIHDAVYVFPTYEHLKAKGPARTAISCWDQQQRKDLSVNKLETPISISFKEQRAVFYPIEDALYLSRKTSTQTIPVKSNQGYMDLVIRKYFYSVILQQKATGRYTNLPTEAEHFFFTTIKKYWRLV